MFGPWKIAYTGTEYEFGTKEHAVQIVRWEQAADVYTVDDVRAPRADGVLFGQDFIEPGEITVFVKIDFTTAPHPNDECVSLAMSVRGDLARTWRADSLRGHAGALAELTIGGEYVVEGRPRTVKFDDRFQNRGLIYAELSFIPAHNGAYSASEGFHTVEVGLIPAQQGGLLAPLVAPLSTSVQSSRARPFEVGGDTSAWPVIEVHGPLLSGGSVELTNEWALHLNRALLYDDVIRIDTRPGRRGMWINGRPTNVLSPSGARLSELFLLPGMQEVALRGASLEGTAKATLEWRNMKAGI